MLERVLAAPAGYACPNQCLFHKLQHYLHAWHPRATHRILMSRIVMKLEICWLVRLALDQNLLSIEQYRSIYAAVGPEAEPMDVAQKIVDDGLITGPVGSGKTTTLACIVDYLNTTRTDPVITVENPIEVVQPVKGCYVSQREVGSHSPSFFSTLNGALREDPDISVIGTLHTSYAPTALANISNRVLRAKIS
jgi:Type II/IV secretion system protein